MVRKVQVQHRGCIVAKQSFEAFKAAAEGLNIPIKILKKNRRFLILDMDVEQYALIEATIRRFKDSLR